MDTPRKQRLHDATIVELATCAANLNYWLPECQEKSEAIRLLEKVATITDEAITLHGDQEWQPNG